MFKLLRGRLEREQQLTLTSFPLTILESGSAFISQHDMVVSLKWAINCGCWDGGVDVEQDDDDASLCTVPRDAFQDQSRRFHV
jgi:hypothetical protein